MGFLDWVLGRRGRQLAAADPGLRVLDGLIEPGDWAIDVGGSYVRRLAELTGPTGRVLAVDPGALIDAKPDPRVALIALDAGRVAAAALISRLLRLGWVEIDLGGARALFVPRRRARWARAPL